MTTHSTLMVLLAQGAPEESVSGSYVLLIVYLTLAIGVSFLCSLVEAGILSIWKPKIVVLLQAGRRSGRFLDATLESFATPLYALPETASVATALNEFTSRQEHIFLVVDEFGGTAGIITLEDALETLLGVEIVDETDSVEDMRKLARKLAEARQKRET